MKMFHPINQRWARHVKPASTVALGAVLCAASVSLAATDPPDVIYLDGTVRDFLKSHPDFNITSATGHVANNVVLNSEQSRPELTGTGFEVGAQWRNKFGDEIAPHLYYTSTLALASEPDYNPDNVEIVSWDSSQGYDPDNTGPAPEIDSQAPMPEVFPPADAPLAPYPGNNNPNQSVHLSPPESTHPITESFQVRDFTTDRDVTINIAEDTDVTIYCTGELELGRNSVINIPESSTLRIYVTKGMKINQQSSINMHSPNNPGNPAKCVIINLGNNVLEFNQTGGVSAQIISPNGNVDFNQANDFFGTIVAQGLKMAQGTTLHWDGLAHICEDQIEDEGGSSVSASMGAISSSETFDEWFTTVVGTNIAYIHTIALTRNSEGVYEYLDDSFFPIDNMLFGNEGDDHNYNFTYTFSAKFEYDACQNHFFEFQGSDDAWLYVNGELALDLGGVMAGQRQVIEMDRLGLEDGETYTLHFYYAQRNPYTAVFHVRTDLPLEWVPPTGVSYQYD